MDTHLRWALAFLLILLAASSCGSHDDSASGKTGNDSIAADDDDKALNCWDEPGSSATSENMTPRQNPEYYIEQSLKYFDTLDSYTDPRSIPNYSPLVARWEWPPWLKLTGFGEKSMIWIDLLLKLYPTSIPVRDCRAFPVQPFGRCHVVFYYQEEPCSIYEEFTFNDQGEMTFIEAWSDIPGLLPTSDPSDYWAEGPDVYRLSTKIPGLGNATGLIDLDSDCLREAASINADVADFANRARFPVVSWVVELINSWDEMMSAGCK
jgi:hypothetical protein